MAERNGKGTSKQVSTDSARKPAAAKQSANGTSGSTSEEAPVIVQLRAKVRGRVFIRLRVLDRRYTADKIVRLLNAGNALWDVGDPARYHRIQKDGKVIAEIEYADEDFEWCHYEPD
jgi:hypothetical protein